MSTRATQDTMNTRAKSIEVVDHRGTTSGHPVVLFGEEVNEPVARRQGSHLVHIDMFKNVSPALETMSTGLLYCIVLGRTGMSSKDCGHSDICPEAKAKELGPHQPSASLHNRVRKAVDSCKNMTPKASRDHGEQLDSGESQKSVALA